MVVLITIGLVITPVFRVNVEKLVEEIHQDYPLDVDAEEFITVSLSKLVNTDENIDFTWKLDAVFKNDDGEFLIVDWKTSKNDNYSSEYRQQLSSYKKAYLIKNNISSDKIKVAIGYIGLRKTINDGKITAKLDMK